MRGKLNFLQMFCPYRSLKWRYLLNLLSLVSLSDWLSSSLISTSSRSDLVLLPSLSLSVPKKKVRHYNVVHIQCSDGSLSHVGGVLTLITAHLLATGSGLPFLLPSILFCCSLVTWCYLVLGEFVSEQMVPGIVPSSLSVRGLWGLGWIVTCGTNIPYNSCTAEIVSPL